MLYDITLTLFASDFKRLDKLSMSKAACLPIIKKALQRQFPGQSVTAPDSSNVLAKPWKVGDNFYRVMDNGREVNRCRMELLGGAPTATLYVIKQN